MPGEDTFNIDNADGEDPTFESVNTGTVGNLLTTFGNYVNQGTSIYNSITGNNGNNSTPAATVKSQASSSGAVTKSSPNWMLYGVVALVLLVIALLFFRKR